MIFTFEIDDYIKVKYGLYKSISPKNYVYSIICYDSIGFLLKTRRSPSEIIFDPYFMKIRSLLKNYKYCFKDRFYGTFSLNKSSIKIFSKIFEDIDEKDELFLKYKSIFETIENISINTKLEFKKNKSENKNLLLNFKTEKIELTPYLFFNFLKNNKFTKWDELEKLLFL